MKNEPSESGGAVCRPGYKSRPCFKKKKSGAAGPSRIIEEHRPHLIQANKLAILGALVSDVAHQIDNPNNLIMFNGDLIGQIACEIVPILDDYFAMHPGLTLGGLPYKETHDQLGNLLRGIETGSRRIRDIVAGLKEFSRLDSGAERREIRLNDAVRSALLIAGNLIKKHTDRCSVEYGESIPPVHGDIQQIEQVIVNLLTNACHALSDRTHGISVRTTFAADTRRAMVVIEDEGSGIPRENMKRIFDPFFTTRRERGGTGLGLPVSYAIARAHGGELLIESVEGKGTTVTLRLPIDSLKEAAR